MLGDDLEEVLHSRQSVFIAGLLMLSSKSIHLHAMM